MCHLPLSVKRCKIILSVSQNCYRWQCLPTILLLSVHDFENYMITEILSLGILGAQGGDYDGHVLCRSMG
jgi:hypothetical protein